jgi:O-antigen/teichoic acid export membrane protein
MTAPTTGRRNIATRALGNAVDQGVSSLSNALAVLLAAGGLGVGEFGWFAVGLTVALLTSNLTRPVTGVLLVLVGARLEGADARAASRRAAGAGLGWGAALGGLTVLAAAALPLPPAGRAVLVVAGLALPALVVQDCLRYVCFRDGRPWRALLSDGTWLAVIVVGLPLLRAGGVSSGSAFLAVWALGAAAGTALALAREGWLPETRTGLAWSWRNRHVARYVLTEQVAAQGAAQLAVLLVGTVVGVHAAGGFRGAQTLLGPITVLQMAALSFVVPELVRRPHLDRRQRMLVALAVGVPLGAANVVFGVIIGALPRPIGEMLLGDAWADTSAMLLPMAVWAAAVAMTIGPLCVLQAMGRVDITARISLVLGPLLLGGALVGAHLGGAPGAAWGMAAAGWAVLLLWWPALVSQSGRQVAAADLRELPVESAEQQTSGRRSGS